MAGRAAMLVIQFAHLAAASSVALVMRAHTEKPGRGLRKDTTVSGVTDRRVQVDEAAVKSVGI